MSAAAGEIKFTVTNNQPTQSGFAFSPVWFGVQDGTYQTFTSGAAVSPSLQNVAELADTSLISAAFAGHGSDTTVGSAPIGPGTVVSGTLNVADPMTNRYLDFASMVVPSNDFFFANQDPKAYELFDAAGNFAGPLTIQIFGFNVWDAGSEVNDVAFGAAFIVGDDINDHAAENGVVTQVFGGPIDYSSFLNSINGQATPYGYDISHLISSGDLIATINIQSVPEPSTLVMFGIGAAGLVVAARRKGSRRSPIA
jgi:hypothetical protein